ncbi:MAG: CoA transferase [Actinobacteria bacterium]|nr:MAG: CoA transferase [Actinomycetota bacterium]
MNAARRSVDGPLRGVRIVDLSTVLSGPVATTLMADQGASVIKVEAPGAGDLTRQISTRSNGVTAMFQLANRGKRAITIDLTREQGKVVMHKLAAKADVFVQNFRPGVADRIGIGYDALREVNNALIYLSISGFGSRGPLAQTKVYDNLIQAASGFASVQSGADGHPTFIKNLACDKITALTAAQAITAALYARAVGRGGQHVELAMLDAAVWFLWTDRATEFTWTGPNVKVLPSLSQYDVTRFKDGWGTIAAVTDEEFAGLCRALGVGHIADDPRFTTMTKRLSDPDYPRVYREIVQGAAGQFTVGEALRRLSEAKVPAVAAVSLSEIPDHPQIIANGLIVTDEHPVAGPLRQPRPAARFSATPAAAAGPAPLRGQDTDAILDELGYDAVARDALRADGAVA